MTIKQSDNPTNPPNIAYLIAQIGLNLEQIENDLNIGWLRLDTLRSNCHSSRTLLKLIREGLELNQSNDETTTKGGEQKMNYQKVIVVGNVTSDVERKTSGKGTVYTRFGVAVRSGKDGRAFVPVVAFDKVGDAVARFVTRGKQVLADGRIATRDGGRFRVIAENVVFGAASGDAR